MAKRIERSRHELEELGIRPRREDEHIERLVLPTDTLQGIALLYNTTVAELKKINHILSESELHARRVIKVPSKGILVDLTEDVARPPQRNENSGNSVNVDFLHEESSNDGDNNGQEYLNNKDTLIKEIKEQAEIAAARSPILNGEEDTFLSRKEYTRKKAELKWWIILLPCLVVLIGFPVLYFLYREQEEELHHVHLKLNDSKGIVGVKKLTLAILFCRTCISLLLKVSESGDIDLERRFF